VGADRPVLTWFDQNGNPAGALREPGDYYNPAISPGGTRVAVAVGSNGARDLWILDVARGTSTRFTFDASNNQYPVWSPDGKSIAFSSGRNGQAKMYVKPADGSSEEPLLAEQVGGAPTDWSRDGRFLLFSSSTPNSGVDISLLPEPGRPLAEAKPVPILATPFNSTMGRRGSRRTAAGSPMFPRIG
jgi:Tol biopolymer transport system component